MSKRTGIPENAESELLRQIIVKRAVEVKKEGFTLVSGMKSDLYVDMRKVTQDPEGINLVARLVLSKIKEIAPEAEYVGGLETGSIPIATSVSMLSNSDEKKLRAFWVRKRQKDHGLQNLIEGNLEKKGKAVIVDDTVTTGGSSFQAIDAVRNFGAQVIQAIAIVDRGAVSNFQNAKVPYFAFFSEADLRQ